MKLALPLLLLSTVFALTLGKSEKSETSDKSEKDEKKDTKSKADSHLDEWVKTDNIDDDVVHDFNDDINDCTRAAHSHDQFSHCIDNHLDYYDSDELTSKQKRDIRKHAKKFEYDHDRMLRGI